MLNKLIIGTIITGMVIISACKKDYECNCTYTDNNGNVVTATHDLNTTNQAQADSACKGFEVTVQGGFTYMCGAQTK